MTLHVIYKQMSLVRCVPKQLFLLRGSHRGHHKHIVLFCHGYDQVWYASPSARLFLHLPVSFPRRAGQSTVVDASSAVYDLTASRVTHEGAARVSVLTSVTACTTSTGVLLVMLIFRRGEAVLSLLRRSYVLPWPGTLSGAAHPTACGSTFRSGPGSTGA